MCNYRDLTSRLGARFLGKYFKSLAWLEFRKFFSFSFCYLPYPSQQYTANLSSGVNYFLVTLTVLSPNSNFFLILVIPLDEFQSLSEYELNLDFVKSILASTFRF